MNIWLVLYLAAGILARGVFFIANGIAEKKYGLPKYVGGTIPFELIAHVLDILLWPYSTFVSFYFLRKEIRDSRSKQTP